MTSFMNAQILTKRIANSKGVPRRRPREQKQYTISERQPSVEAVASTSAFLYGAQAVVVAGGGLYQARGATRPTQPSA